MKESKKELLPCMCHGLPLTCMDTTEFMLRGYNVIFQKKKKKTDPTLCITLTVPLAQIQFTIYVTVIQAV